MTLFNNLGFHWDRSIVPVNIPAQPPKSVCTHFQQMMPQFIWDMSVLEGNPLTLPEVKILLNGGMIHNRQASDREQVLRLAEASKHLISLVKEERFCLDKSTFCVLHNIIACDEALECGHFRGEGNELNYTPSVGLGERGYYEPLPTVAEASVLNDVFEIGINTLEACTPFEKGCAFFLFGALRQFFFDGNKRTSRFMMNGVLMSAGIDAITIPAMRVHEFNEKMVRFYLSKDATELFLFLTEQKRGFEVHQPNKESSAAMEELESGKGSKFNSVDELMVDLGSEDE